jgi:hypothetical protein
MVTNFQALYMKGNFLRYRPLYSWEGTPVLIEYEATWDPEKVWTFLENRKISCPRVIFFSRGATAPSGSRSHSVGLLWANGQPDAETST